MFAFGNGPHLILHIMPNGKQRLPQLPVVYLCQEVGLVLYRIRTRTKPLPPLFIYLGHGIMPRGDQVIVMTPLLVEGPELDQSVAHHIRIGCKAFAYLIYSIGRHLVPILLMTVDHFKLAPILMCHGRCHLYILLAGAVPLLILIGTDMDIEAIGL